MNRGCGKRKPGGVYICTKLSTHGVPLEEFIIDPPRPYEGERFRAPTIFEKDGVCHLLFWVGKAFYPFPSDFIEEVRRFGASKRVPVDFPIEKLSAGSLMFFVHPRAIIKNHNLLPPPPRCQKGFPDHLSNETIGDTVYSVTTVTTEGPLEFSPGIFLRLPITDIDHVLYKDGKADPRVKEREVKIPLNYTME
jgi:hypothetical protein